MATAVHFGAGKIGLGFIGDLLHQSGYHIVFADVVEKTVAQLRKEKQYRLFLIDHDYQERIIDNVDAVSSIEKNNGLTSMNERSQGINNGGVYVGPSGNDDDVG